MKKDILLEIDRFREISGLKLLSEGLVPTELLELLAKAFNRSEDEFLESLGKGEMVAIERVFDDVAEFSGKRADDIIEKFKYGSLSDDIEDIFIAKLLQSGNDAIKLAAIKSYSKTKPSLIDIVNTTFKTVTDTITNVDAKTASQYIDDVNSLIDGTNLSSETKKYLKNELSTIVTKSRASIKPKITTPPTIDEVWEAAEKFAKSKGKELPPKEYFLTLEGDIIKSGITKEELINRILKDATDKKSMIEWLKQVRAAGTEIGNAMKDTVEGGVTLSKKSLGGWGIGALLLLGGIAWAYNWGGLRDSILHGSKSGDWKEIYKENFYNLPEDIQNVIVTNYEGKASNDSNKSDFIKSFDYNEDNERVFKVIFHNGSVDEWNKVNTNGVESWSKKVDRPNETTTTVVKKMEEFKDAAKNKGGFDTKTSFEKKSDTKYWGVDEDGSESTVEWDGTTFIVSSGHN